MSFDDIIFPPNAGKVSTSEQMRDFDRRAESDFGVPSLELMENAGWHVAQAAADLLDDDEDGHVTVVAGKGNNGGDGFVAARHLLDSGAEVSVFLIGDPSEVKGDAKTNLDILIKNGLTVTSIQSASELENALGSSDVVIDAIFGTGLRGDVHGLAAELIQVLDSSGLPVVAVDVPSGLDADTGKVLGTCVRADVTVTFALAKIGLLMYPGAEYVGKLVVVDIGIPSQLYDEVNVELPGMEWVAERLPCRSANAHKGTFGSCLVIAGSAGFTGAAALAGEAALRSGTGLSTVAIPKSLQDIMAAKLTEVMTRPLPETDTRAISAEALDTALSLSEKADAVTLGCGLGTHPDTCEFVRRFVASVTKPLVADADALNCLSKNISVLEGKHGGMVITPHPGEMARLLGTDIAEIESNRLNAAREAASRFNCVVVLKGARTLVAEPSGRVSINTTGNSGMASGGTGDVLAGIIGGLLAQGLNSFDASVCGVFIHGLAGDIAADQIGQAGMIAGDLLLALTTALKEIYGF